MSETWTVQRMLDWMARDFAALGIDSPRLDAELLLGHALGCDRVRLYMDMPRPLDVDERARIRALVVRRRTREPVAYILGEREFYRRRFAVGPAVLVPRPETELLVDRALELLPQATRRVLDLCTGSGVIAITLALERLGLEVDAADLSEAALSVARDNARRLEVGERVRWHSGDLFGALPASDRYDLIVANPPYVREDEYPGLAPEITHHEPRVALLGGASGLSVIERLCAGAPEWLAPGGTLLFEIGHTQAAAARELLAADPRYAHVATHRDHAGIDRMIEARAIESG